jgi:Uma2 family endonuclease
VVVNVVNERDEVHVPDWVVDLESFTRWADSDDVDEKARIWFLNGEVWVDLSREQVFAHVLVKTEILAVLGRLIETKKQGLLLGDGVRMSNIEANYSVKPDGVFVAQATLASGRVRVMEGCSELEGTPDMVLEVVSPNSVKKDKVLLRQAYAEAGIPEYRLVDAREEPPTFDILSHKPRGYVAVRKQDGWMKSAVFGKSFRLVQHTTALGHPDYTLEVR